jgi:hypothetical protein
MKTKAKNATSEKRRQDLFEKEIKAEKAGSKVAEAPVEATAPARQSPYAPAPVDTDASAPSLASEEVESYDASDEVDNHPSQDDDTKVEVVPTERADEKDTIAALSNEKPDPEGANEVKAVDPKGGNDKRNTLPDDAEGVPVSCRISRSTHGAGPTDKSSER